MVEYQDILATGVILFVLALGIVIIHYATDTVLVDMITNPIINDSNTTVGVLQDTKDLTNRFDYIVFGVFIGLILSAIVGGYLSGGAHPVLMFIYFLILVVAIVVASLLSYVWLEPLSTSNLATTISTSFPITNHLITYLPIYVSGISFIGLIIMFLKRFATS